MVDIVRYFFLFRKKSIGLYFVHVQASEKAFFNFLILQTSGFSFKKVLQHWLIILSLLLFDKEIDTRQPNFEIFCFDQILEEKFHHFLSIGQMNGLLPESNPSQIKSFAFIQNMGQAQHLLFIYVQSNTCDWVNVLSTYIINLQKHFRFKQLFWKFTLMSCSLR